LVYPEGSSPESGDSMRWLLKGPSTCMAATLAIALIVLRLRRPCPRRRRLVIQPGFVACVATLVALLLGWGCGLFFEMVQTRSRGVVYIEGAIVYWSWAAAAVPGFVLGAWLGLWLAGRSAPEPSWIDRAGRALGLFWIAGVAWSMVGPIIKLFAPML